MLKVLLHDSILKLYYSYDHTCTFPRLSLFLRLRFSRAATVESFGAAVAPTAVLDFGEEPGARVRFGLGVYYGKISCYSR